MIRAHPVVALLIVVSAVAIAGCGSGDDEGGGRGTVVSVSSAVGIGPLLVNGKEITVYEFRKDRGTKSECNDGDGCAESISPLLTNGPPEAKGGAIATKLGTTERIDGTTQVTYAGHPLYTWREEKPGEARGRGVEAFEGKWYPLRPSGKPVEGI